MFEALPPRTCSSLVLKPASCRFLTELVLEVGRERWRNTASQDASTLPLGPVRGNPDHLTGQRW